MNTKHKKTLFLSLSFLVAIAAATACFNDTGPEPMPTEQSVAERREALGPVVATAAWGSLPAAAIHGVGGTKSLLFALVPEPSAATPSTVLASSRLLPGPTLGAFTPPPEGFRVPLSLKVLSADPTGLSGYAVILDNRAKPAELGRPGQQPATLYKYHFALTEAGFTTNLITSFALPINTTPPGAGLPNGTVFPGSIAVIPGEGVALTDNFGAMWFVTGGVTTGDSSTAASSATPVLLDRRFIGQPGPAITGVGKIGPGAGVSGPYTLLTPPPPYPVPPGLGIYPGMHSVSYHPATDSICFAVTTPGGVYCITRGNLIASPVPFFAKTGDNPALPPDFSPGAFGMVKQVISPSDPDGVLMDGWDTDATGADASGYYMPAPTNKLFRVALTDPSCAVVGPCPKTLLHQDSTGAVFNWTNELAVLPPLVPALRVSNLVVSTGQEFNNPAVNGLLTAERYFGPSYYGRVWATYLGPPHQPSPGAPGALPFLGPPVYRVA